MRALAPIGSRPQPTQPPWPMRPAADRDPGPPLGHRGRDRRARELRAPPIAARTYASIARLSLKPARPRGRLGTSGVLGEIVGERFRVERSATRGTARSAFFRSPGAALLLSRAAWRRAL